MIFRSDLKVFLAPGATDLRKSINGLSNLVENQMELDLFSGYLFGFCNKNQTIVKLLYWDRNGFCLWMKRLEVDKFKWPNANMESLAVSQRELSWLLDGLSLRQSMAHQKLNYTSIS